MGTWVISLKHDINQKILNSINHMMISEVFFGGSHELEVYIYKKEKRKPFWHFI